MSSTYIYSFIAESFDGKEALIMNMVFQEDLELSEAVWYTRHKLVHSAQVFVLIVVKEILEFGVEALQVLLDQYFFASLH